MKQTQKKKSRTMTFTRLIYFSMIALVVFSSFTTGMLWFRREHLRYRQETEEVRNRIRKYEQELVKREVENTIHYIYHEINFADIKPDEELGITTNKLQQKALNMISQIRFGEEGYVFIVTYDGIILTSAQTEDPTGEVVALILNAARDNREGTFIEYSWRKLTVPTHVPKISFVAAVPEWDWVIGAGFYLDDKEQTIQEREIEITGHFRYILIETGIVLFLIICLAFLLGRTLAGKIIGSFQLFTKELETRISQSTPLPPHNQQFIEFQNIADSLNIILDKKIAAENAAAENAERFRQFADSLPQVVFELDNKGHVTFANQNSFDVFGFYGWNDFSNVSFLTFVHPSERKKAWENYKSLCEGHNKQTSAEFLVQKRDGTTFNALVHLSKVVSNDTEKSFSGARGVLVDITENKRIADQLSRSLQEKEILLKELHHRTKNNLQIISSILRLQSSNIEENQFDSVFLECQNRVHSMALVHEHLYRSTNLSLIAMDEYITDLIGYLRGSYPQTENKNISITQKTDPSITMNIDKAIPCGLIINEIISNSFKHAFPNDNKGDVFVQLQCSDHTLQLEIKDNGIGVPQNIDLDQSHSLGIKLIKTLTLQLEGSYVISTEGGLGWLITFPE